MALERRGFDVNMIADVDLNSYQYHFVMPASTSAGGSARRVKLSTGTCNPAPIGILQNDPRAGDVAQVRIEGVSRLMCNLTASGLYTGRTITCASDGHGEPAGYTKGSASGTVFAQALDAAGGEQGDDVHVTVLIRPFINLPLSYWDAGS